VENTNDKIIEYIERFLKNDYENLKETLQYLLKDYKKKNNRLEKILKHSDKQQQILINLNIELDEYKKDLEKKVEEEIIKREEKEKMLIQQSKLASMGEMMDAVAHQWKQPINTITVLVYMLTYDLDDNKITLDYIKEFQEKIFEQVGHMTNTLDEFRSFFRPNKKMEEFDVKSMIDKVLLLLKDELYHQNIKIEIDCEKSFKLLGIENEFKHLILNIINNAKDAFNERKIKDKTLNIKLSSNNDSKTIEITDNAGGIPLEIIDDIFKANVTTKQESKGTGIGLYMSSQIAQKHNGILSVENVDGGAKFVFKIQGVQS
jgi:C4-dicarboxylate-specific signal transduction histidine kinase